MKMLTENIWLWKYFYGDGFQTIPETGGFGGLVGWGLKENDKCRSMFIKCIKPLALIIFLGALFRSFLFSHIFRWLNKWS